MGSVWRIKPQIIKRKGVEIEVPVKQVTHCPKRRPFTGELEGFFRLKDHLHSWQVLIQRANWPAECSWACRWNPTSGYYKIVWRRWDDPVDPWARNYQGVGHVIPRVDEAAQLSMANFMQKLAEAVRDPEFEGLVLGTLHSGASLADVA